MTTFDEARAACVERWGEPVSRDQRRGHTTVAWVGGHRRGGWPDSCWLECVDGRVMLLAHSGTEERLWLLAGTYPDAPTLTVTPLPDALLPTAVMPKGVEHLARRALCGARDRSRQP